MACSVRDKGIREAAGDLLKMANALVLPLKRHGGYLDRARENSEETRRPCG
jgi:hypothetical protein